LPLTPLLQGCRLCFHGHQTHYGFSSALGKYCQWFWLSILMCKKIPSFTCPALTFHMEFGPNPNSNVICLSIHVFFKEAYFFAKIAKLALQIAKMSKISLSRHIFCIRFCGSQRILQRYLYKLSLTCDKSQHIYDNSRLVTYPEGGICKEYLFCLAREFAQHRNQYKSFKHVYVIWKIRPFSYKRISYT
jgi:hypothetical protein